MKHSRPQSSSHFKPADAGKGGLWGREWLMKQYVNNDVIKHFNFASFG